ncbi:MAG: UDP-3-O-(3-hydroxymyristoyl)glucosamine N-acyltransferase [Chthoniobacterales bacterium]|nr:UDP-3-O-(3-hydroxymyristoyl)glucosamine N-acyltransferase [Chthoniobacterales bacterium]
MMTLQEIAEVVQGELLGSPTLIVRGVASLRDAQEGDLAFYASPRYLSELRETEATAVLVPQHFDQSVSCSLIKVEHPSAAFDRVIALLAPPSLPVATGIHPQAIVEASAVLGKNISLGPYVVIEEGVEIGDETVIGAHSFIGAGTKIGKNCLFYPRVTIRERCIIGNKVILQPGVVIGSCGFGYVSSTTGHEKIPQLGIVEIQDDVEIGANTTIDRARFGRTLIGHGTKIDNLVQIAHNVVLGPHNMICSQVGISGSTRTGLGVTLAGQVGLSGHIEIGDRAIIGAQSGLSKNVPPGVVVIGSPAKPIEQWKKNNFYVHNLGKLFDRVKVLEKN